MISKLLLLGIATSVSMADYNLPVKEATYIADPMEDRPVVSLCDGKGIVIRSSNELDMCLTIKPVQEEEKPKSFLCSHLEYKPRGVINKYYIDEKDDACMIKLRSFANSKGISINSPIEFSYDLEKDQSGVHDMVGTVAVHLKWAQHDAPLNQLSNKAVGGSKSSLPSFGTAALTVFLMTIVVLL